MIRLLPRYAGWLLLPIVGLAGVLRFDLLVTRGLLYWDEGKFALEGVRILSVLISLPVVHPALLAGKAIGTAKPGHALLIALSYALFGVHDYAPLLMNATASVLQVVVLFFLARQFFGPHVALLAAALLAIAGYDIVYARSALSESDANLLFLTSVLIWSIRCKPWAADFHPNRPAWSGIVLPAIILGAAFTVNYRLIVFIAVLVPADLVIRWKREGWRSVTRAAALWAVGLSLLPLAWQVIGVLAQRRGVILFRSEIDYLPTSYFHEVLYQLHGGKQSVLRFSPLPYLQWYTYRQGVLTFTLLLLGLGIAAFDRSPRWVLPASLVLIPYGVYVFAPFIVPRNLDAALPFAALLSAAALARVLDQIRVWRARVIASAVLATVVMTLGILQAWPLTTVRSGFAQAATYLKQHGSHGAIVQSEIMRFYLRDEGRGCDAPPLPTEVASLAQDNGIGGDYAVVDNYFSPTALYLAHHARVVAHFPTSGTAALNEDLVASEDGVPPGNQHQHFVDVFSLDDLPIPDHGLVRPQVCTLDQLP
ncbi:MAG: glycosyltransferase family 39 protein [Chloroflexota bacterium]|nr:glycosyltransferase family 39 protein [Chloroflexota bacterium]